jgi:glutaminase
MPFDDIDDADTESPYVSTGSLPADDRRLAVLQAAYERFLPIDRGAVADYIPALAAMPADLYGMSVVGVNGGEYSLGDAHHPFTIQSISKAFVFALVLDAHGPSAVRAQLGVNATGLPFNSIMAIELSPERITNPMVNSGAIATTSLIPGDTAVDKWAYVLDGLSAFAGRRLEIDDDVYESEAATNQRNEGMAHLMGSYERLWFDPDEATDVYTRQCSLLVTARDLAVMGATLADGGVNPVTGARVIAADYCRRVLAVMATAGLYERSGEWLYDVGLPGKSGVAGGIVTVAPGKGGLGVFSPRLDETGTSVRGQLTTAYVSRHLGLNLFSSTPVSQG